MLCSWSKQPTHHCTCRQSCPTVGRSLRICVRGEVAVEADDDDDDEADDD